MSLFRHHRTSILLEDGYRRFDALIAQLRIDGQQRFAEKLDYMMRHVAWTTGSELIEEFGTELDTFRQRTNDLSPDVLRCMTLAMEFVRQVADKRSERDKPIG